MPFTSSNDMIALYVAASVLPISSLHNDRLTFHEKNSVYMASKGSNSSALFNAIDLILSYNRLIGLTYVKSLRELISDNLIDTSFAQSLQKYVCDLY